METASSVSESPDLMKRVSYLGSGSFGSVFKFSPSAPLSKPYAVKISCERKILDTSIVREVALSQLARLHDNPFVLPFDGVAVISDRICCPLSPVACTDLFHFR